MFGANRAPILHRNWLPTDQNKTPHDPRHLGVPSSVSKTISEPMVSSAPTVHLSCTDTGSQQTETRIPLDPRHLGVPSGMSKMIYEPMVCSAPIVHLSYTDTGSQQTETRFHLTHITKEYHWVRPKRFPSLWYVWYQPCTYLASTSSISKWTELRYHLSLVT